MKLFLAGINTFKNQKDFFRNMCIQYKPYFLESFYYINDFVAEHLPLYGDFLLDSGAFTFIHNSKNIDYKKYTDKYIEFINRYNISNYFEMDIDNVIGYKEVLYLRSELEKQTNKKTIPVFHKSRGLKDWHKTCEEYDYVAIGTIREYASNFDVLQKLVKIAKKYNTKVHGLGFTALTKLKQSGFYSVDSTTWNCGNRYGIVNYFDGNNIVKIFKPKGKQVKTKETLLNNFIEWLKFQKYVDKKYYSEVE